MLDWIKEYGIKGLVGVVISGLTLWVSRFWSKFKKQQETNCAMQDAMQALIRNQIVDIYYKYIDLGYIPAFAHDSLYHLYDTYKLLNGNGFIEDLMNQLKELPTKG